MRHPHISSVFSHTGQYGYERLVIGVERPEGLCQEKGRVIVHGISNLGGCRNRIRRFFVHRSSTFSTSMIPWLLKLAFKGKGYKVGDCVNRKPPGP